MLGRLCWEGCTMECKSNCTTHSKNCLRLLLAKSNYNIHKTHRKVGIEEDRQLYKSLKFMTEKKSQFEKLPEDP